MFVHTFGAFFGIAVSTIVGFGKLKIDQQVHKDCQTKRIHSEIYAGFGVIFLWVLWPNFNSVFAPNGTQLQSAFNTIICLCGSAMTSYYTSMWLGGKFSAEIIRDASLSGGIIVGSSVNLLIQPWIACIGGLVAGFSITIIHYFLSSLLKHTWFRNNCGVLYLHGFMGIVGSCAGMIATAVRKKDWNDNGSLIWGISYPDIFGTGKHSDQQAQFQLAELVITLTIAIGGGIITGIIVRLLPYFSTNDRESYFSDQAEIQVPKDFLPDIMRPIQPGNAANIA